MSDDTHLHCLYPQEMFIVFGDWAALEAAKPLMREIACFSRNSLFAMPPFSTASAFCRRALDGVLPDNEYRAFLGSLAECVHAARTRTLDDDERYFSGALVELEQTLAHPFRYDVSPS